VQVAATPLLVPGQHASGASHMLLLSEATSAAEFCPTRLCFFLLCLLVCRSALPAAELTRMVAVVAAKGSAQIALAMRLGGAAAGVLDQLRWLEPAGRHLGPLCSLTTVQAGCTGSAGEHSAAAAAVAVGGRNRPCKCLQGHQRVFVSPWGRGEQAAGRQAASRPGTEQQVAQRRWWYFCAACCVVRPALGATVPQDVREAPRTLPDTPHEALDSSKLLCKVPAFCVLGVLLL
jgi:hypothetical protein